MLGIRVPELICTPCMVLYRVVGLLELLHRGPRAMRSSRSRGCDVSPSLLPHCAGWIDIVDVRARSPLAVSGALYGLDGEKAKALSTSSTIPSMGSERSFQFSPMV
jgi:hypothetical protein